MEADERLTNSSQASESSMDGADAKDPTDAPEASVEAKLWGTPEVEALTGISAYTIRYYDKCGFFPHLSRGKNHVRAFSEDDIRQLRLINALRQSGLSIEGLQYFVKLLEQGPKGKRRILRILKDQETSLGYQIEERKQSLDLIAEAIRSWDAQ